MKQVYTKFDSFINLKIKDKIDQKNFLKQLRVILNSENKKQNLSGRDKKIFDQVRIDLFQPTKKNCTGFT